MYLPRVEDICGDTLDNVLKLGDAHYLKSAQQKPEAEAYLQVTELYPFINYIGTTLKLMSTKYRHEILFSQIDTIAHKVS